MAQSSCFAHTFSSSFSVACNCNHNFVVVIIIFAAVNDDDDHHHHHHIYFT